MYSDDLKKLVREGYAIFERFVIAVERIANAYDRMVPQYTWTGIGGSIPVVPPSIPSVPTPFPQPPQVPYVGDPLPGWNTTPRIVCTGQNKMVGQTAMTQADGMGDDSGTRGD